MGKKIVHNPMNQSLLSIKVVCYRPLIQTMGNKIIKLEVYHQIRTSIKENNQSIKETRDNHLRNSYHLRIGIHSRSLMNPYQFRSYKVMKMIQSI